MDKKFAVRFVSYWTLNVLVLALINVFFPASFELGNAYLSIPAAAIFAGFLLTVLLLIARGLARRFKFNTKGRVIMFLYYWGASSAGVWLVARVASVSGFGIAKYTWAIVCGFVVSFTNWGLRQTFKGMKMA